MRARTISMPCRRRRPGLSSTSSPTGATTKPGGRHRPRPEREQEREQERAMDTEEFRQWSHRAADWAADYRTGLRAQPVRSPLRPGATTARIADVPPERAEPFERI